MKQRKRKGTKRYIILGFLLLYLSGMVLMTYMIKNQYYEKAMASILHITEYMSSQIEDVELIYNEDNTLSEYTHDHMAYIISTSLDTLDQYSFISSGLLDPKGNLIAQTSDCIFPEIPGTKYEGEHVFRLLNDYFTEDEIDLFRKYYIEEQQKTYSNLNSGHGAKLAYNYKEKELMMFVINESEERIGANGTIETIYLNPEFRWQNPDYIGSDLSFRMVERDLSYFMSFPYAKYGEEHWQLWKSNSHLHNYLEGVTRDWLTRELNLRYYEKYEDSILNYIYMNDSKSMDTGKPNFILLTNVKIYPWHAAFDQLSEIYLYSACFVAVCMAIILYFTDKTTKKQLQLEQTRRDFTNAVAHELKTPIAIVRNLFENMERETSEEKNSYYRQEGIRQTEVMDDLIKEMIFISKIDSDKVKLSQESISILSILEDQMKKLEPLIDERNLHVQFWKEDDFTVIGDRAYLEKAIFNLLENAVSYNRPDGRISIRIEKDSCMIENTADPIPEEDLPHLCDMFFTSNKSRKSAVNHKGLGLYLAKRILDMHGLKLIIANSDIGVQVTLNRK